MTTNSRVLLRAEDDNNMSAEYAKAQRFYLKETADSSLAAKLNLQRLYVLRSMNSNQLCQTGLPDLRRGDEHLVTHSIAILSAAGATSA
jgi:hypothetical protein